MSQSDFTSADFHTVVQKQILNAVSETLAAGKLDWEQVRPFLEAARDICRSDFRQAASIRLHTVQSKGDGWVDAEEAYLGISVASRDDGTEWLSETYWLSDIAKAEQDPEQVKRIVAALERSIARLNAWLDEQGTIGDPAEPE